MIHQADVAQMFWYKVTPTLVGLIASAVFVAIVARRRGLNAARWTPTGLFFGAAFAILGMLLLVGPARSEAEGHPLPERRLSPDEAGL